MRIACYFIDVVKLELQLHLMLIEEERKFSLVIWEQTEEFKQKTEEAEQKRRELVKIWKNKYGSDFYVGLVETAMDEDREPIFWIILMRVTPKKYVAIGTF